MQYNFLNEDFQQDSCAICLNVIGESNKAVTQCKHHFCLSCLLTNLRDRNTCPICREIIEEMRPSVYNKITIEDTYRFIDEITSDYNVSLLLYMIKNINTNSFVTLTVHIKTMMTDLIRKIIIFQNTSNNDTDNEDEDEDDDDDNEDDDT